MLVGVFFTIVAFVVACYAIYTMVCYAFVKRGITHRREPMIPTVTLIVCAYNEETMIEKKIENISQLDYPVQKMRVLFVNDHSDDRTRTLLEQKLPSLSFEASVIDNEGKRGKPAALNQVLPGIDSQIVIMTDADSFLEPQAIQEIVKNFSDPEVGGANGLVEVLPPGRTALTHRYESLYRKFYNLWRKGESALHSITICNGPLMAFRSVLLHSVELQTMADDTEMLFYVVGQGKRVVYDETAVAFECTPTRFVEQFSQKMRRSKGVGQVYWRNLRMLFRGTFGRILFPFVWLQVCVLPYFVLTGLTLYALMVISDPIWLVLSFPLLIPRMNRTILFLLYTQIIMAVSPLHHRRAWRTMKSSREILVQYQNDDVHR